MLSPLTVALVCGHSSSLAAVMTALEAVLPPVPIPRKDTNVYAFGKIGKHDVVINCLPAGQVSAAPVISDCHKPGRLLPERQRYRVRAGTAAPVTPPFSSVTLSSALAKCCSWTKAGPKRRVVLPSSGWWFGGLHQHFHAREMTPECRFSKLVSSFASTNEVFARPRRLASTAASTESKGDSKGHAQTDRRFTLAVSRVLLALVASLLCAMLWPTRTCYAWIRHSSALLWHVTSAILSSSAALLTAATRSLRSPLANGRITPLPLPLPT